MTTLARQTAIVAYLSCLAAVSGCATVDNFGNRAYNYNAQFQRANKDGAIANVIRAAYYQPLQFSTVSTVTGQATGQVSITSSLPFAGIRGSGAQLYSISPGAQLSGGPQFSNTNLNTEEFLSGANTPVSQESIAAYVNNGYDRFVVLSLLEEAIQFDFEKKHYSFINEPSSGDFPYFMSVLNGLVSQHLTFIVIDSQTVVGPPLTDLDVVSSKLLPSLEGTSPLPFSLKEYQVNDNDGLSEKQNEAFKAQKLETFYRLVKTEKKLQFCFDRPDAPTNLELATVNHQVFRITIPDNLLCSSVRDAKRSRNIVSPAGDAISNLSFTTRSVRQLYGYLGALARDELTQGPSGHDLPLQDGLCTRLFAIPISEFGSQLGDLDVTHDVASEAKQCTSSKLSDYSEMSLSITAEMTALYSSAKSFPPPNAIGIIAP
jgi:hypothetical protein